MKKQRPIVSVEYIAHGHKVLIDVFGSEKKGFWGAWRCPELLNCIGAGKSASTVENAILYAQANAYGGVGGHRDC
jgi:hypothetical protein